MSYHQEVQFPEYLPYCENKDLISVGSIVVCREIPVGLDICISLERDKSAPSGLTIGVKTRNKEFPYTIEDLKNPQTDESDVLLKVLRADVIGDLCMRSIRYSNTSAVFGTVVGLSEDGTVVSAETPQVLCISDIITDGSLAGHHMLDMLMVEYGICIYPVFYQDRLNSYDDIRDMLKSRSFIDPSRNIESAYMHKITLSKTNRKAVVVHSNDF